jgi:hypothetical protein
MKFILLLALVAIAYSSSPLLVTREYTEYLKKTVDWEVEDYENNIFKGLTFEDAQDFLGWKPSKDDNEFPEVEPVSSPSEIDWSGASCDVGPQDQGHCGSCWAFAATGSLSARCCMHAKDNGWLSPQELVSCDKGSNGCSGGTLSSPVSYAQRMGGLVPNACFPYKAANSPCPNKCTSGGDWKKAHVCKCASPRSCSGTNGIVSCLSSGPVTIGFNVCQSFMNYKSGIYKCDCTKYLGGHAVLVMGHKASPECSFHVRNSWGKSWGQGGYFDIACTTCALQGGSVCGSVSN